MTTIRDVARCAKVSVTTASYALNGVGSISEATRQRVLKAAEELNYHPNAFARHLKKVKTQTIGVFITSFGGAFWDEILEGIHEVILTTEYDLVVCPRSRSERRLFMYRQVDGAIVFDSDISDEIVLKLASRRFPIVVMDRLLQADFVAPVLLDNAQGVRETFRHFYDQGLRRMAFVSGDLNSFDNTERMQTFLDEARKHCLQPTLHYGAFTEHSGYSVAKRIIQSGDLPQAVFCANDQMAIGFLRAMQEHGLNAPEDIAVVGFDDILLSRYVQPTLSTVGASRQAWGASAIQQLIAFLEHETPLHLQRIPTRLLPRQSSVLKHRM